MRHALLAGFLFLLAHQSQAQWTTHVPEQIDPEAKYLFYLHGGVVQAQGLPAVSTYYGKYEYKQIVQRLSEQGFHVISEVRPKDSQEKEYADKVSAQIDSLSKAGVPIENISIVGASLGAYITMELALQRNEPDLKYALLGLCSEYAVGLYEGRKMEVKGRFFSIYEASDSKSTCQKLFSPDNKESRFKELRLEMGNDHAFLFKPYKEWLLPLSSWIKTGQ